MNNPISPQLVYIVHQEKIQKLEREIEMARIAKAQRARNAGSSFEQGQTWYAQAVQWLKAMLFDRKAVNQRASSQPETLENPCPVVPC